MSDKAQSIEAETGKEISFERPQLDRLNIGCGRKRLPHAVNVDISSSVDPDLVLDLNQIPWPFPAETFGEVFASDVIEHCDDVIRVMEEVHRVCRDGAIVHITVPHFSCVNAFTDPTHQHFFSSSSFQYVTGEQEFSFYTEARYRNRATSLVFFPTLLNKLIHRLANRWPDAYERRWAWMFPAWFIYFELEVRKRSTGEPLEGDVAAHACV